MTRRLSFASQTLLLQLGVLILVLAAGLALVALLLQRELEDQYEQRALGIARSVAADPAYARGISSQPPTATGDVQVRAEAVRRRSGALFVVVTDDQGRRYSHPNTSLIGQRVSTDPTEALAGHEVVALQRGTLGLSARGKAPLTDASGTVVGEVSVGIDAGAVHRRLVQLVRATLGFGGLALLLGAAGSVLLSRRLKRQTLGLEPAELADLVREHEAVLHGIENGVVAVEAERVTVANDEARRLLGSGVQPGASVTDVLPPRLGRLVAAGEEVTDALVVHGDRTLVVSTRRVQRQGRDLGAVVTVQDRTQLEHLTRELETVQTLFDALRAQSHEHTNRLHALQGMLHLGHIDQATDYLSDLADSVAAESDEAQVADPYLRGLLVAKTAVAAERGVQLRLSEDTRLTGRLTAPLDVVTVLGNLVDNAIRAAAEGERRPAWVEVGLVADDSALHCAVSDSGAGLSEESRERVFDDGWTTQPDDGQPHGIGLALARQAARRHGGDLRVLATSGPDHGAVFAAELHVMAATVPAP